MCVCTLEHVCAYLCMYQYVRTNMHIGIYACVVFLCSKHVGEAPPVYRLYGQHSRERKTIHQSTWNNLGKTGNRRDKHWPSYIILSQPPQQHTSGRETGDVEERERSATFQRLLSLRARFNGRVSSPVFGLKTGDQQAIPGGSSLKYIHA